MDNMALSVTDQCHIVQCRRVREHLKIIKMNIHKKLQKIGRELAEMASTQAERN